MKTYKMYAAVSNSDNLCSIQVNRSGRLKRIRWAVRCDFDADTEYADIELSTQATSQIATHDSIGDIDCVRAQCGSPVDGTAVVAINETRDLDYPMAQGERFYLHCATTSGAGAITVFLDFDEK